MNSILIPCDTNEVSDGYHTFGELYDHRYLLFIALMIHNKTNSWISKYHHDGTCLEGWFIAGMNLPSLITYHLPDSLWYLVENNITILEKAPEWDGHTFKDVLDRLYFWIENKVNG